VAGNGSMFGWKPDAKAGNSGMKPPTIPG
jgi:hypothetical protein